MDPIHGSRLLATGAAGLLCPALGTALPRLLANLVDPLVPCPRRGLHQHPQASITSHPQPSSRLSASTATLDPTAFDCLDAAAAKASHPADPLGLDDPTKLYAGLTSEELASALLNLELVSRPAVVTVGTKLLSSQAMKMPLVAPAVFWGLRHTMYSHFCAGGTVEEAAATLTRLWQLKLRGILDYSVEDAMTSEGCDRNLAGYLHTIGCTSQLPSGAVSAGCVKMSALCPIPVLEKASALLRWQHTHPDTTRLPWCRPSLPIFSPESQVVPPTAQPDPLDLEEEAELGRVVQRLRAIANACEEKGLPLLVDAEYLSIQPAIDHLTYSLMLEMNQQHPVVATTVQGYLMDAFPRLATALDASRKAGVAFGVKLVRGAYIDRETDAARAAGVPSPIQPSIAATHSTYDKCAALMIDAITKGGTPPARVVLATHNVNSGRVAAAAAAASGLQPSDPRLHFAQLKGMADGLSLGLSSAGFFVSKYLPFGTVQEVMPYLIRRAQENKGLLGNTAADRQRMRGELWRRLQSRISG